MVLIFIEGMFVFLEGVLGQEVLGLDGGASPRKGIWGCSLEKGWSAYEGRFPLDEFLPSKGQSLLSRSMQQRMEIDTQFLDSFFCLMLSSPSLSTSFLLPPPPLSLYLYI